MIFLANQEHVSAVRGIEANPFNRLGVDKVAVRDRANERALDREFVDIPGRPGDVADDEQRTAARIVRRPGDAGSNPPRSMERF